MGWAYLLQRFHQDLYLELGQLRFSHLVKCHANTNSSTHLSQQDCFLSASNTEIREPPLSLGLNVALVQP